MNKTASGLSRKDFQAANEAMADETRWRAQGVRLWLAINRTAWELGDWWNHGEPYGDRVQTAEEIGWDHKTCRQAGWVAQVFDVSRRRDTLSWSHHVEVAGREDADAWLDKSEKNGWTRQQLRTELKAALPTKPTPALPAGTFPTIVADPPWPYDEGWPEFADKAGDDHRRLALPYQSMTLDEIRELDVADLLAPDAHLFLWTTNRYLRDAFDVTEAWGFEVSQVLVWCKPPRGIGPGGIFSNTAEFLIYGRAGSPAHTRRVDSTWWTWPRGRHSEKPAAFLELVESVCPGPYLEMFARTHRPGWEAWGLEA